MFACTVSLQLKPNSVAECTETIEKDSHSLYVLYLSEEREEHGGKTCKCVEQYQAWGGGLTLPIWTDVQGWHEGNFSMTEVPGTPVPAWVQKILRSKKHLADIAPVPLLGA